MSVPPNLEMISVPGYRAEEMTEGSIKSKFMEEYYLTSLLTTRSFPRLKVGGVPKEPVNFDGDVLDSEQCRKGLGETQKRVQKIRNLQEWESYLERVWTGRDGWVAMMLGCFKIPLSLAEGPRLSLSMLLSITS